MPIPITIPKATITMEEANVISWRKRPGEAVSKEEVLYEIETDKVILEVPPPAAGFLLRIDIAEGTARLGQTIGWIGEPGEIIPEAADSHESPALSREAGIEAATSAARPGIVAATPAARRLARELGVDLGSVAGTGPGGRILEIDIHNTRRNS